ncbi:hypothetical protein D3C72_2216950 [compost metagenome]
MLAIVIQCLDGNPVGEQRAGGIELLAIEHETITFGGDARLEFQGVLVAAFGACVADARTLEHALE